LLVGLALGVADAGWVATTTPFTAGADTAVAAGFALMAAVAVATLRRRHGGVRQPAPTGALWPWVAVLGLLVGLELVAYLVGGSDRHAWPTLSALYDAAATHEWAKGVFAVLWLAMGWGLFRR
ncbi:MAG: hypothetical protein ACYC0E_12845, partial [Acidimicrobiales bacterium]